MRRLVKDCSSRHAHSASAASTATKRRKRYRRLDPQAAIPGIGHAQLRPLPPHQFSKSHRKAGDL
jgi:hypothetical protein